MEKKVLLREILENRLIEFALNIKAVLQYMPNDEWTRNLKGQLSRSSTSPAFNYGEAQSAESQNDFIHKMSICLKELREIFVGLKFIKNGNFGVSADLLNSLIRENTELISIFAKSVQTAKSNANRKRLNK